MGSRFPLAQIEQALLRTMWPYSGQCSLASDGSLVISFFEPHCEDSCLTLVGLAPEDCLSEEKIAELVDSIQADLDAIIPTLGLAQTREHFLSSDMEDVRD